MSDHKSSLEQYVQAISESGLSIYDYIEVGDRNLWIPTPDLEILIDVALRGTSLQDKKLSSIKTRSKFVKELICKALGYPVPKSFKKTKPRFPGQFFDTYIQKSNNLQIWNDEPEAIRRYVLIRVSSDDLITKVKVVTGDILAKLDTTGTLTQKYQAKLLTGQIDAELVTNQDSNLLLPFLNKNVDLQLVSSPINYPKLGEILPIEEIFNCLRQLIGQSIVDIGYDQECNRGAALHRLICQQLGYQNYQDDGRFPDIRHQLLEVKLQTSPTIDLGLVCPDSKNPLDVPKISDCQIRHCDVRYAIFYAVKSGGNLILTKFYLTTGERFFSRFPQFQGKVLNKKLQIPLPTNFFDS